MAQETEIDRLVVRLIGDQSSYKKMLNDAAREGKAIGDKIVQESGRVASSQEQLLSDAARLTARLQDPMRKYGRVMSDLKTHLTSGRISQETYQRAVEEFKSSLPSAQAKQQAYSRALSEAASITNSVRSVKDKYSQTVKTLKTHLTEGRISQETYNKAIAQARQTLPSVRAQQEALSRAQQRGAAITRSVETAVEKYGREARELKELLRAGYINQRTYNRAIQNLRSISSGAADQVSKLKAGIRGLSRGVMVSGGVVAGFGVAWNRGVTQPIQGFLKQSFGAAIQMRTMKMGLKSLTGSSEAAQKRLEELKEVAKLPGLGLQEAVRGAIQLENAGASAQLATDALSAFGNAIARVGGGRENLSGVTRQVMQMLSMGRMMGEEIRVISEHMPQFRQAVKAAFGTADMEAIRKAGITVEQFLEGTIAELNKLEKMTGGPRNAIENLGDEFFQLRAKVGEAILQYAEPAMQKLTQGIIFLKEEFTKLSPSVQKAVVVTAVLAATVGPLAILIGGTIIAVGGLVAAISAIGLPVIAGIAAVATAITALGATVTGVTYSIMGPDGIAEAFKSAASFVQGFVEQAVGFFSNFRENWATLTSWVRDNWQDIMAELGRIIKTVFVNMAYNAGIGVRAIMRVWTVFQGWAFSMFKRIFTVDMLKALMIGAGKLIALNLKIGLEMNKALAKGLIGQEHDFSGFMKQVEEDFNIEGGSLQEISRNALKKVGTVLREEGSRLHNPFEGFKSQLKDVPNFVQDVAKEIGPTLEQGIQEGTAQLEAVGLPTELATQTVKGFAKAVTEVGGGNDELGRVVGYLSQMASKGQILEQEFAGLASELPQLQKAIIATFGVSTGKQLRDLGVSVEDFFKVISAQLGGLKTEETTKPFRIQTKEMLKLTKEVEKFAARLKTSVEQIKMDPESLAAIRTATDEVKLNQLARAGATEEMLKEARAFLEEKKQLAESREERKKHNELVREAEQITERYKTPRQKYIEQLLKLNQLHELHRKTLGKSGISTEIYRKAVTKAKKELADANFKATAEFQVKGLGDVRAGTDAFKQLQQDTLAFLEGNKKAGEEIEAANREVAKYETERREMENREKVRKEEAQRLEPYIKSTESQRLTPELNLPEIKEQIVEVGMTGVVTPQFQTNEEALAQQLNIDPTIDPSKLSAEFQAVQPEVPTLEAPEVDVEEPKNLIVMSPSMSLPDIEPIDVGEVPVVDPPAIEPPMIEATAPVDLEPLIVDAPDVAIPRVDTVVPEDIDIETPQVEDVSLETLNVEVPDVQPLGLIPPEVETPEIETPEVPGVRLEPPDIEITLSELEQLTLDIAPPEVKTPELEPLEDLTTKPSRNAEENLTSMRPVLPSSVDKTTTEVEAGDWSKVVGLLDRIALATETQADKEPIGTEEIELIP